MTRYPKNLAKTVGFVIYDEWENEKGGKVSHWVAFFVKLSNGVEVDYFNSLGGIPTGQVYETLLTIIDAVETIFPHPDPDAYRRNVICALRSCQIGNECGTFAVHFLWRRALGVSYLEVKREIKTQDPHKLRETYWQLMDTPNLYDTLE